MTYAYIDLTAVSGLFDLNDICIALPSITVDSYSSSDDSDDESLNGDSESETEPNEGMLLLSE